MLDKKPAVKAPKQMSVRLVKIYSKKWAGKCWLKRGEAVGKNKTGLKECIQLERREELVGLGFDSK